VFAPARWSFLLRLFRRRRRIDDPTPLTDDSARRLVRAPETPRRLDLHVDSGLRDLHGRDPPPFAPRRRD